MYYIVVIILYMLVCRVPELCAYCPYMGNGTCEYWTNNKASCKVWHNLEKFHGMGHCTSCIRQSDYCVCNRVSQLMCQTQNGSTLFPSNGCHFWSGLRRGNLDLHCIDITHERAEQSGNNKHMASLAIDGHFERGNGSCSKPTANEIGNSYLRVTLKEQYVIRQVMLYTAYNKTNLAGMEVYVLPNHDYVYNMSEYFCGRYDENVTEDEIGRTLSITCSSPMKGSVVQIQNNVTGFRVCELTVIGYRYHDCQGNDPGDSKWFYGSGCLTDCHCTGPCDDVTGTCPDGEQCEDGYELSADGVCGCPAGTYGLNCTKQCLDNCTYCHDVTGNCVKCEAGYVGRMCTRCSTGTWSEGDQCRNCSTNCTDGCNIVDGTCYGLCPNGSYGEYCDKTCKKNTWGPGNPSACIEDCECNDSTHNCDPISGLCYNIAFDNCSSSNSTCPASCVGTCNALSGDCDGECVQGFWGKSCSEKCECSDKENYICDKQFGSCPDGRCRGNIVGESCNITVPTLENTKFHIYLVDGMVVVEMSNVSDVREIVINSYLVEYKVNSSKEVNWTTEVITSHGSQRVKRAEHTDVALNLEWEAPFINSQYLFRITPDISTDGYTGPGPSSQVQTLDTGCGNFDLGESCHQWCQCSNNPDMFCLKTCDICYTCNEEPSFPSSADTVIELNDVTVSSMTVRVNTNFGTSDLNIVNYTMTYTNLDTNQSDDVDFDVSGKFLLTNLASGTPYQLMVFPLLRPKDGHPIYGFPLMSNASTLSVSYASTIDNVLLIVILCVVTVLVLAGIGSFVLWYICFYRSDEDTPEGDKYGHVYYSYSPKVLINNKHPQVKSGNDTDHVIVAGVQTNVTKTEPDQDDLEQPCSNPIKCADLEEYIRTTLGKDNGARDELESIPNNSEATTTMSQMGSNEKKNRFKNIPAYDHSRVVLWKEGGDLASTYINAAYINGYEDHRKFIATQGPMKSTSNAFWRMIWETKASVIVMLTKVQEGRREKCYQYWPLQDNIRYGNFNVVHLSTSEFAFYMEHHLELSNGTLRRHITHLQFISWPDHGVPKAASEFLEFEAKVSILDADRSGPLVVHCSAGVGRTGTFISVNILKQQARVEHLVDVKDCVQMLRKNRKDMIQTPMQYRFVFETLLEEITIGATSIQMKDYLQQVSSAADDPVLLQQYNNINKIYPLSYENDPVKNTSSECKLLMTSRSAGNLHLRAAYMDTYRKKDAFISMPTGFSVLEQSLSDFWNLMYSQEISGIVLLGTSEETYWPTTENVQEVFRNLQITMTTETIHKEGKVVVRTFDIKDTSTQKMKTIRQWHLPSLQINQNFLEDAKHILEVEDLMRAWQLSQRHNQTITVTCRNGVDLSGMFIAVCSVMEKMRADRYVDVAFAVKQLRQSRENSIRSYEQYQILHQVVRLAVLGHSDSYYNTPDVEDEQ